MALLTPGQNLNMAEEEVVAGHHLAACLEPNDLEGARGRGFRLHTSKPYLRCEGLHRSQLTEEETVSNRDDQWPRGKSKRHRLGALLHRWLLVSSRGLPAKRQNLVATHICGNPACLRVGHLKWQTRKANLTDVAFHLTVAGTLSESEPQLRYARPPGWKPP